MVLAQALLLCGICELLLEQEHELPARIVRGASCLGRLEATPVPGQRLGDLALGAPVSHPDGRQRHARHQLRLAYQDLGAEAVEYFDGLVRAHRAAGYHARKILALRERYHTSDLVHALTHALRFRAFEHHAIERILLARARPRRFDEYIAEATARTLASIIEQSQTEPRPLADYDLLPCAANASPGDNSICQPPSDPAPSNPSATRSAPDSENTSGHSD